MKDFIIFFITILLSNLISKFLYHYIGMNYNVFRDKFDLLLFIIDFGIYFTIFLIIYSLLREFLEKEKNSPIFKFRSNEVR